MNANAQPPFSNLKNVIKGKENYKIGFVFLVGYLLGFFKNMKANKISKTESMCILFTIAFFCSLFY